MADKIGKTLQIALSYNINELIVFGSFLYSPTFRDVDIGICFDKAEHTDEIQSKFELQMKLEELFGTTVDLILLDDHFQSPLLVKSLKRKGLTLISEGKILEEALQKLGPLPSSKYLPTLDDLEDEMNILEDMIFQTLYKGFSCMESWTEFNIVEMDEKGMRRHGMFMISTALQVTDYMRRAAERIGKFLKVHELGISFEFPLNSTAAEQKVLSFSKPTLELYEGLQTIINSVRKEQRLKPDWESVRLNCRVFDLVEDRFFEELKLKVQLVRELYARKK